MNGWSAGHGTGSALKKAAPFKDLSSPPMGSEGGPSEDELERIAQERFTGDPKADMDAAVVTPKMQEKRDKKKKREDKRKNKQLARLEKKKAKIMHGKDSEEYKKQKENLESLKTGKQKVKAKVQKVKDDVKTKVEDTKKKIKTKIGRNKNFTLFTLSIGIR